MVRDVLIGEQQYPDTLELYPTFARLHEFRSEWRFGIQGRVVTPRPDNVRRKLLLGMLRKLLKATPEQLQSETFQERVRGFLMLSRQRRKIRIHVGERRITLRGRSKRSGHFRNTVRLPASAVSECIEVIPEDYGSNHNPWCVYHGATKKSAPHTQGLVQLIDRVGPSVISDIDDTIKRSNVADRQELLANTFFHPFREVAGMAELYQGWLERGAAFHYVSSSPWQLYKPLAGFFHEAGFPLGSFHLRSLWLRDPSVLQLLVGKKGSKKRAIKSILKSFPRRHFVLIGDLAEKDPEIYGTVARKYSDQILQICLRRIPGSIPDAPRLNRALREIPSDRWRVFDEPSELSDLIPEPQIGWQIARLAMI